MQRTRQAAATLDDHRPAPSGSAPDLTGGLGNAELAARLGANRPSGPGAWVDRWSDTYDRATDNAVTRSAPFGVVTNNGVGGGMTAAQELIANGRQIAIHSGSTAAESLGRLGVRSTLGSVAAPTPAGFDPAMSGRSVRSTRLGEALSGTPGAVVNGGLGVVGMAQGADQFFQGLTAWDRAEDADGRVRAGLDLAGGAAGAGSGAIGVASALGADFAVAGTTAAGMGTAVGAAGAVPIAGAVLGGAATGLATAARGQQFARDEVLLGANRDGSARDWSDAAADAGVAADDWVRERSGSAGLGTAAGLATTLGGSVVGAAGAAVTGVAGLALDACDAAGSAGEWLADRAFEATHPVPRE